MTIYLGALFGGGIIVFWSDHVKDTMIVQNSVEMRLSKP